MTKVDFKDLDSSHYIPSRKFIGETLFINLTEYKTFRNQQVYRLMMTPKHRLYDKSKSNVGGWIGENVELDEDVWIDEDTVIIGKSFIHGGVEITHGSRINNSRIIGNGTIRAANINKSEIRGSFNIGHGTEIKKSTLDGITILDMTAINLGKVKIAMENCKFMRWKKFGSAATLHLTSGVYKNVTGDNVCHIELHFGQVDEGAVDRVIMEDVHLRTQGNIDIRGVGLVYLNNVVVNSDAVLEHLSDLNHLIVINENVTKEWKRLEL